MSTAVAGLLSALRTPDPVVEPPTPPTGGGNWLQTLGQTNLTKPTGTTVIPVSTWADFKTEMTNLGPNDEIRLDAEIPMSDSYQCNGAGGSAGSPAVVNGNGYKMVNAGGTYGSFRHSMEHINCDHIWFWDMHWDGGTIQTWGPTFGARHGSESAGQFGACTFITVAGCVSENMYQQGFKASAASHDFVIDGFEVRHWSCGPYTNGAAGQLGLGSTALYMGEGSGSNAVAWSVYNFDIRSLWVHDIGIAGAARGAHSGMALQIKHNGRNFNVREFLFETLHTRTQGALNVNYDTSTSVDCQHVFEDFVIRDVIRNHSGTDVFGGQAVTVGGSTILRNGLMYDLDSWGVQPASAFPAAHRDVEMQNLTIFNTALAPNAGAPRGIARANGDYQNSGGSDPVFVNENGSLIAPSGADYVATAADFVGPITGTADAGTGTGSGFQLAASSSIPATAGALGKA